MQAEVQDQLEQGIDLMENVYETVVGFLVGYSFQLVGAVLVLIAGFIVANLVARVLLRAQERRDVDVTLRQFIASAMRIVVIVLFLIIALGQLGISITPLIAAVGGLAVGASFAIQGPVSNYGAGLVIILTRMFRVGDTVTVLGRSGLVEDINLATTVLRAEDGEEIVIPNKHIVGEVHRNSYANRVIEGQVGIAYGADPETAIQVIRDCIRGIEEVTQDPQPQIGIASFGDSSINIDYRVWVPTGRYFDLLYRINLAVFQALRTNDIAIPFPQREVRLLQG